MVRRPFDHNEILLLRKAIDIAEEVTSNFYQISTSQWKRYRYDIQSLKDLKPHEITNFAFAQIRRYARSPEQCPVPSKLCDFFKICLQDHVIRHATVRDPRIELQPLSIYIVTHELIHVVRFARFIQRFETEPEERDQEETRVHTITHRLLKDLKIQGLSEVLEAFRDCRTMETFVTRST